MEPIDILRKLLAAGGGGLRGNPLIDKWGAAVRERLMVYARASYPVSPFIDKPTFQKDFRRGRFRIDFDKENDVVKLFGVAPNAARLKDFNAPVNKMHPTRHYRFRYKSGRWVTYGLAQTLGDSVGVSIYPPHLYGKPVTPEGFFGWKPRRGGLVMAYGRTLEGKAMPIYGDMSFADWLMESHGEVVTALIMETGLDVMAEAGL